MSFGREGHPLRQERKEFGVIFLCLITDPWKVQCHVLDGCSAHLPGGKRIFSLLFDTGTVEREVDVSPFRRYPTCFFKKILPSRCLERFFSDVNDRTGEEKRSAGRVAFLEYVQKRKEKSLRIPEEVLMGAFNRDPPGTDDRGLFKAVRNFPEEVDVGEHHLAAPGEVELGEFIDQSLCELADFPLVHS